MLLSAAIIVRDEAEHLDACLVSLDGLVDEIVVVDTGSSDGSVDVALRHGAVVGHEPWQDDFATPRNRSLDLASGTWILYIDADERVRPGDHAAVRAHLRAATDHVSFRVRFVPRVHWTPYREFRLWRHRPDIRFRGAIHESMLRAITAVAERDALLISDLDTIVPDGLTIEHFGYEGDQSHKHARNEPMLREALTVTPDRPFLYDHLARIYEDRGELDRARATWRAGIEVARARTTEHPDDRLLWINLLVHAVAREDPDGDVAAMIGDAQQRYPGNPAVEFAIATHELTTGEPARAAGRLEHLIELDLDAIVDTGSAYDERIFDEWAWNALGLCRFQLDDDAGAAEAFRHAEAADPENGSYRTRRLLAEARAGTEPRPPRARRYGAGMADFEVPADLSFNRGLIADPAGFARDAGAASWLYLCGEDFAAMDGGMSYAQVQDAVPESENIVSDPPVPLDLDLARRHMAAIDRLPRPTLVTCRTGPRSSAIVYLYAGLKAGASADEVLARADADEAPFAGVDAYREFVAQGLEELAPDA